MKFCCKTFQMEVTDVECAFYVLVWQKHLGINKNVATTAVDTCELKWTQIPFVLSSVVSIFIFFSLWFDNLTVKISSSSIKFIQFEMIKINWNDVWTNDERERK